MLASEGNTETTQISAIFSQQISAHYFSTTRALSPLSAPRLGALAIQEALRRAKCPAEAVEDVYFGCVLPAGMMQAPDRQAMLWAGIPDRVPTTMVNKVCASGMKSIMLAAQELQAGRAEVAVAGGMESMSNVPYYLPRGDTPYGGIKVFEFEALTEITRLLAHDLCSFQVHDGLTYDGLTDVYNKFHMGNCGENTAQKMGISRKEQDDYAIESYHRSAAAYEGGNIQSEIFDVEVTGRKKSVTVKEDDEYKNINEEKFRKLATVFQVGSNDYL